MGDIIITELLHSGIKSNGGKKPLPPQRQASSKLQANEMLIIEITECCVQLTVNGSMISCDRRPIKHEDLRK